MSWAEFEELTLAEFEALEESRAVGIRHARFNAALVASVLINANRSSEDSEPVSPFDFIAGFESDPEEAEAAKLRKSVKRSVALAFTQMKGLTREQVLIERNAMAERMRANGIEDPEDLIREVFPDL